MGTSGATPHFLSRLADRARRGEDTLVDRAPELRRSADEQGPAEEHGPAEELRAPAESSGTGRRSAVLVLVAGTDLQNAQLVLEERGHALRSQPGQFSLPGGKADPTDRDAVHTAMREAREETGLEPDAVSVLGSFAAIPMPWRAQRVTPVLAWAPRPPQLHVQDPIEVERLVWAPMVGAGSLTDPRRRMRGILHGQPVGPVFDLPDGAFVWGFTAVILEQVLTGLGLDPVPLDAPVREIPVERRR